MSVFFSELPGDALLHLNGKNIAGFLQGQLTCDTRNLDAQVSVSGALCTPAGRVISDLRLLLGSPDTGMLRLSSDLLDHTAEVLGKYAMFSRITLDKGQSGWLLAALWGEGASDIVRRVCGNVPEAPGDCARGEGWCLVRSNAPEEAYECYLHRERGARVLDDLRAVSSAADESSWRAMEMRSGLLRLSVDQTERHTPQALNYDLAGLVSFRKGCYTGQEVVARLHYRGKPKRRCVLLHCRSSDGAPVAGTNILSSDGKKLGESLRSARESDGSLYLFALLPLDQSHNGLRLESGKQEALETTPLPYTLQGS